MKVTVAGANCFIGREILKWFCNKENIEITAVVRRNSQFNFSCFANIKKIIKCDMWEYKDLGKIAGGGDCFINLSWAGSRAAARQDAELQKQNYQLYMDAMKNMADVGYTTLVTAGSQAEYGKCESVITEKTLLNPDTEYGKYKAEVYWETKELAQKYNIRFIEPRYFSLYGPYDYSETLIMKCIRKMIKNEDCRLNECSQIWDYLYVGDAVEALYNLCNSDQASGVYNFASGEHKILKEYIMEIHEVLGSRSNLYFEALPNLYDGLIYDLCPVVDKLKQDADWKPKISFAEGILRTVKEYRVS